MVTRSEIDDYGIVKLRPRPLRSLRIHRNRAGGITRDRASDELPIFSVVLELDVHEDEAIRVEFECESGALRSDCGVAGNHQFAVTNITKNRLANTLFQISRLWLRISWVGHLSGAREDSRGSERSRQREARALANVLPDQVGKNSKGRSVVARDGKSIAKVEKQGN